MSPGTRRDSPGTSPPTSGRASWRSPAAPPTSSARRLRSLNGLRIAMQGTGHNAVPMGPLDDTMLVKTCGMRGVEIDADHRVARVEAGALWIDVTAPASEAGLAPHASGGQYLNFAERPTDPAAYYGEETYARLCRVKARVDPLERFRGNQEIPAA